MNKKFWNWIKDSEQENVLRLDGVIAEDSWFDDDVTPAAFRAELESHPGDVIVWINSPGGDVFAGAQIYNMLMEHKGNVTVRIDGLAASAASVIAMAGSTVEMSPVSTMMIHNPWTMAVGDENEMKATIDMLKEIKESIINAYELKTGLSRDKISKLMDGDTFMNARKALDLGFADRIMYADNEQHDDDGIDAMMFSRAAVMNSLCDSLRKKHKSQEPDNRIPADIMRKRLSLLSK